MAVFGRAEVIGGRQGRSDAIGGSDAFGSAASGDFAPTVYSGLQLWLDAGTVTLGVGGVQTWTDLSGNANHATQVTAGLQPVNNLSTQNGFPAVHNDHVDDYMTLATPLTLTAWDIFVVGKTAHQVTAGLWLGAAPAGNVQMLVCDLTTNILVSYDGSQQSHSDVLPIQTDTTYSVLGQSRTGVTASYWQNGTQYATNVEFGTAAVNIALAQLFRNDTTVSFACDTLAILVYNRQLAAVERSTLVSYLRQRFAV